MSAGTRRARVHVVSSILFGVILVALAVTFRRPLVAWFTGKSTGSGGAPITVHPGPFTVEARLDPDPPGTNGNALVLEVRNGSGKPVDDASLDVVYDMPAMGAMQEMKGRAKVEHEKDGRYRAEFDLPMAGSWTLKASIRAPSGNASQDFTVTVGTKGLSPSGASASVGATASNPESSGGLKPIAYPPMAADALRTAVDAADRIRGELAEDGFKGVPDAASTIAEALRAAASAAPGERQDARDALLQAVESSETLGRAKSLDEVRHAFADFNARFIPVVGADARLASGLHVFECSMFENARWIQKRDGMENPYMGTKMPTCGTATDFRPPSTAAPRSSAAPGEIDHYTCSMHPSVKQQGPGVCPICGMQLVPVTKEQQAQGVVMIDEKRQQLIGVRTGKVIEAPMRQSLRAVGQVVYDESNLSDVNLKVQGWITKLFVSQTGQRVTAGQTLFLFYSPELYNAQQDFLLATQGSAASAGAAGPPTGRLDLARAARQRLHLLGIGDGQIDAISKKGAPLESIAIASPASGFVIEKNVVQGASVDPGMRLYRIAALGKVWVEADVYEGDLPSVRVGQSATVTLDFVPGRSYEAKVGYIYPYLNPTTRTGRVRFELANKELDLRPGMYARVELASNPAPRVQVPASAVVYTGPRRLVFVDMGEGRFRPQEIRVGAEANGMYEVLSGLKAGDSVATSGIFLIAAEARISTAAKYWDDSGESSESDPMGGASADPGFGSTAAPSPAAPAHSMNAPGAAGSPRVAGAANAPSTAKSPSKASAESAPSNSAATVYTCPMHPEVLSPKPGKCPICGMDLVPKTGGPGK